MQKFFAGVITEKNSEIGDGPLYTLEEIYEAQVIQRRDFLNIAYYNGNIERNEKF